MSGNRIVLPDNQTLISEDEYPLTVREAAKFLGVSQQTVYLWVERKQIPHLRVMGRNLRFLKSELASFRASFKQKMENVLITGTRWSCFSQEGESGLVDSLPRPRWHSQTGVYTDRRLAL